MFSNKKQFKAPMKKFVKATTSFTNVFIGMVKLVCWTNFDNSFDYVYATDEIPCKLGIGQWRVVVYVSF